MKIKCLIIDDEPLALRQLETYAAKVPYLEIVGSCPSAAEAVRIMDHCHVDAMFCDINMPGTNGMDFVKGLAFPPLVVFTTAYSEYAIEGYKVDAVDYLLKPFGFDDFKRAAEKIRGRLAGSGFGRLQAAGQPVASAVETSSGIGESAEKDKIGDSTDSLFIKTEGRMVRIRLSEISYIEAMSEYLKIHFSASESQGKPPRPVMTLYSMKRLEDRLPSYFMRIHRSYIVNLRCIKEVSKTRVLLAPDTYLPIGDLYKKALSDYLTRNFIGK